uniref:DUF4220 domain-containing protein n=1 Tax=Oryza brachyantha TaxID=4533 RepID=J3KZG9_ORYBR
MASFILKLLLMQYPLVSVLMAFTAIVAVVQLALSTYGHRCRHPALRFLQWGASAVFIPLTASIISYYMYKINTIQSCSNEIGDLFSFDSDPAYKQCMPRFFSELLIVWTVLIQIIKGNIDTASVAVVTDGSPVLAEAGGSRPFVELLAYSIWTMGLVIYYQINVRFLAWVLMLPLCVVCSIKVVVKLAAFHRARGSFALGKNVNVIAGYMTQLYDTKQEGDHGQPPRYIVIGEEKQHLERTPDGYRIKVCALGGNAITSSILLTLDQIWQFWSSGHHLLVSQPRQIRDLFLSFSLFKILRRRFAGYPLVEVGSRKALDFVLRGMLGDADDHDRTFQVLIDELSFAVDFYYSCLPWSFIGGRLAIIYVFVSMLIVLGVFLLGMFLLIFTVRAYEMLYLMATLILTLAVLFMELWSMMSDIRSIWTKLALLHHYIKKNGHLCFLARKVLTIILRFGAVKRFDDKLGQNTMLEHRQFYKPPVVFPKKLFHATWWPPFLRCCRTTHPGPRHTTRRWQKTPRHAPWPRTASMITATHLSQYCSYLVAAVPEMLPDDASWTKAYYKEVAEDIAKVRGQGGKDCFHYSHLVNAFGASSRHRVLQEGSKLVKHLVREAERQEEEEVEGEAGRLGGEAVVWELLAEFWSEMVLYLAPSDNVKSHVEALSRGGEFITLLWALLLHAGITSRPGTVAESA